ncbi:MAG: L-aspartate oxidase, partial [Marmoricola sp.]
RRIAQVLPGEIGPWREPAADERQVGVIAGEVRPALQATMTERVGVLRSADGLGIAAKELSGYAARGRADGTPDWETTNLVTISAALTEVATLRQETRGSHWREDYPQRDDTGFAGHFDVVLVDGAPLATFHAATATDDGAL